MNWDATDATDATNADATDRDATDATHSTDATHATDATDLETPAVNPAAFIPVEPTPAVRTQLRLIICLGDLLEMVVLEISLTTCSLRCRNQFAGGLFHSCSANKGELIGWAWRKCVGEPQKSEGSAQCALTPLFIGRLQASACGVSCELSY